MGSAGERSCWSTDLYVRVAPHPFVQMTHRYNLLDCKILQRCKKLVKLQTKTLVCTTRMMDGIGWAYSYCLLSIFDIGTSGDDNWFTRMSPCWPGNTMMCSSIELHSFIPLSTPFEILKAIVAMSELKWPSPKEVVTSAMQVAFGSPVRCWLSHITCRDVLLPNTEVSSKLHRQYWRRRVWEHSG